MVLTSWLRTSRLALAAAREALEDAGWSDGKGLSQLKVGVCIGTTVGGSMNDEQFYRDFRNGENPDLKPIDVTRQEEDSEKSINLALEHRPEMDIAGQPMSRQS